MAKWSADSGILRKKPPEKHDDLLVFGYACKLFRDDEKAQYVDQGRHLIPWMGDEKLKIDRYDCRGALSDLSSCEASREGYDAMRWLGLSDSERRLEQLCDEERYRSLHTNEEEEELYKEEELKRLSKTNNEFQYTYDVPQKTEEGPQPKERYPDVEEEPYVAPVELDVPADIALPKTVKENARIEKTALFVSRQGPQMEILIKAKQGDNPQFAFLNRNDALYKFYRHLLNAIKTGRYKVQTDASEDEKQEEGAEQWSSQEESYLHPSLSSAAALQPAPTLPTVPYRPSADCAYSQLVNRIQGAQSSETTAAVDKSEPQTLTYEQQQYYQYYYTQQYYEYCKQVAAQRFQAGESGGAGHEDATKNNEYLQMAYAHYVQQQQQQQQTTTPNNSYAQIVSNLNKDGPTASALSSSNPYSALVETLQQSSDIEKAPVIYTTTSTVTTTTTTKEEIKPQPTPTSVVALTTTKKPLSSLADYGSDSDGDEDDHEDVKTLPPEETRVVIDKMASYVAKNGTDFETIVKSKGDPRFNFLDDGHEFYAYYRRKIREFTDDGKDEERRTQPPPPPPSTTMTTATTTTSKCNNNNNNNSKVEKKVIAPVCFSIKKPKDEPAKDIKSALPVEESSDEEASETPTVVGTVTTTPPIITSDVAPVIESDEAKNGIFDVDDPILEMIDLTDDLEERKDAKRAEDRIKDKLAAAAREKLASVSRDRALQLERRKKAAAFLKLKSVETTTTTATTTTPTTPPPTADRKKKRRRSEDERKRRKRQPEESDVEEGEIRKRKHKKSHKRKRAKSKGRKKSKKRRRRSESRSSRSSHST